MVDTRTITSYINLDLKIFTLSMFSVDLVAHKQTILITKNQSQNDEMIMSIQTWFDTVDLEIFART